jgi:prophage regulatory protein
VTDPLRARPIENVETPTMADKIQRILRRAEVERATGMARSTLYDAVAAGRFPKPVKITEHRVGWVEAEVIAWQKARVSERDAVA